MIEPGGVGSNFLKDLKMSTKMSDPVNSPYGSMQSSMSGYLKQWAQNTIHPSEVARVFLPPWTTTVLMGNLCVVKEINIKIR
ncbi:MAG: hypothetical protein WA364_02605 [Candidatus Nitrosopolaris sp.]